MLINIGTLFLEEILFINRTKKAYTIDKLIKFLDDPYAQKETKFYNWFIEYEFISDNNIVLINVLHNILIYNKTC